MSLVQEAERGQGQALDHHLHAEVGHVPAAVVDDVVEQHPQVGVDLEPAAELLLEVAGEDLDVAGLVDDLRAGVQLGVVPRHGLDDLGRAEQRALLAVEELARRPAAALDAELEPLLVAPLLDGGADVVVGSRPGRGSPWSPATTSSRSTSVSHGRSVVAFHCPVLAFSYSLRSCGRASE